MKISQHFDGSQQFIGLEPGQQIRDEGNWVFIQNNNQNVDFYCYSFKLGKNEDACQNTVGIQTCP